MNTYGVTPSCGSRLAKEGANTMATMIDEIVRSIVQSEGAGAQPALTPKMAASGVRQRDVVLIGARGSGKTILTRSIVRAVVSPEIISRPTKFFAEIEDFPQLELSDKGEDIRTLEARLANYADQEGLQVLKTNDAEDLDSLLATRTVGKVDLRISHDDVAMPANLSLNVSDLPGVFFMKRSGFFEALMRTGEADAMSIDSAAPDFNAFREVLAYAAHAGILLITIPMRYARNERTLLQIQQGLYLRALYWMISSQLALGKIDRLPQVVFCFSKYESCFVGNEVTTDLPMIAQTKAVARRKLVEYFNRGNPEQAIWKAISSFQQDLEALASAHDVPPPSNWLACMSSFGFKVDGAPNLAMADGGDMPELDMIEQSSCWRKEAELDGEFHFDIHEHWRPLGVLEPFYIAAAPALSDDPDFFKQIVGEERPMLSFQEFVGR